MRSLLTAFVIAGTLVVNIDCADAGVFINVDKTQQKMRIEVDGQPRYEFTVSTGRAGYGTPNGTYHPQRLERTWFSKEYYNSPMPYSIFFNRGFAIHGSYEISQLGGPASHGCIRLHPSNAAKLFSLVQQQGADNTTIVVSGSNPPRYREIQEAQAKPRQRYAVPETLWGYNLPNGYGYGYGRSYPNYPTSSRDWARCAVVGPLRSILTNSDQKRAMRQFSPSKSNRVPQTHWENKYDAIDGCLFCPGARLFGTGHAACTATRRQHRHASPGGLRSGNASSERGLRAHCCPSPCC